MNKGKEVKFIGGKYEGLKGWFNASNVTQPRVPILFFLIPIYPYSIFSIPINDHNTFFVFL
jgi:hypothetical protein